MPQSRAERTIKQITLLWILFIVLLAACSPVTAPPDPTLSDPTPSQTLTIAPTKPTETITPTPTRTPVATRTPLPFVVLDGLRVAYEFKGNLYVQDSGKQPVQLTYSGQDHYPLLSDDGQKIVFYRENRRENNPIYTINADGSQEQVLLTDNLLTTIHLGYEEITFPEFRSLTFVPQTHQLLFSTSHLDPSKADRPTEHSYAVPNHDLLLVDADSAKIRQIMPPGQAGYFQVSPNGKLIWVLTGDHLNIIGLDGKTKNQITDYPPLSPERDFAKPDMYWTQDSRRLTLAMPPAKGYMDYALPYFRTLWQYSPFENSSGTEIQLNPPPIDQDFSISPDGNWIIYSYYYIDGKNELTDKFGVYLGNLRKGTSQLLDLPELNPDSLIDLSFFWNRDSIHFIVEDNSRRQLFIEDINGHIAHHAGSVVHWIDNTHYLYGDGIMGEIGNDNPVRVAEIPREIFEPIYFAFVFLKH